MTISMSNSSLNDRYAGEETRGSYSRKLQVDGGAVEGSSTVNPMKRRLIVEESITSDAKIRVVNDRDTEDRISNLPEDLVHCILKKLPLYDVATTSILSKTWSTIWIRHPELVLDELFFSRLTSSARGMDAKLSLVSRTVEMILLAHRGPILNVYLFLPYRVRECPLNLWFEQLSNKGIRSIQLEDSGRKANVPFSLFYCTGLTKLILTKWILCPPRQYQSFNYLKHVTLQYIIITADMSFGSQLQELNLESCSGIEHLDCQFTNSNNLHKLTILSCTIVDWRWFECTTKLRVMCLELIPANTNMKDIVSLVELLSHISSFTSLFFTGPSYEVLAPPSSTLMSLTTKVVSLEKLTVSYLKLHNWCHIEHTLYLFKSFPNLKDLQIRLVLEPKILTPTELSTKSYLESLDREHVFLDRLENVKIMGIVGSRSELHLIKLLLATSPALKRMSLLMSLICNTTLYKPEEKLRIKKQLQQTQQLPRLSLEAQVIVGS